MFFNIKKFPKKYFCLVVFIYEYDVGFQLVFFFVEKVGEKLKNLWFKIKYSLKILMLNITCILLLYKTKNIVPTYRRFLEVRVKWKKFNAIVITIWRHVRTMFPHFLRYNGKIISIYEDEEEEDKSWTGRDCKCKENKIDW